MDAMVAAVINGKGIMPPRGGGDFSDEEIAAAVKDMLANSGM
jgi:cytochrome c5